MAIRPGTFLIELAPVQGHQQNQHSKTEFIGAIADFRKNSSFSGIERAPDFAHATRQVQFLASPRALLMIFCALAHYFLGAANCLPLPLTFE